MKTRLRFVWTGPEFLLSLGTVFLAFKMLGAIQLSWWLAAMPLVLGIGYAIFGPVIEAVVLCAAFFVALIIEHRLVKKGWRA